MPPSEPSWVDQLVEGVNDLLVSFRGEPAASSRVRFDTSSQLADGPLSWSDFRSTKSKTDLERLVEKAMLALNRVPSEERGTSTEINECAELLWADGELSEAKSLFAEALAARRERLGDHHPATFTTLSNLGWLLAEEGDLEAAEEMLLEAVAGRREALGKGHADTLGSIHALGSVHMKQKAPAKAKPLFAEVVDTRRNGLGWSHPDTLAAANAFVAAVLALGQVDEAAPLLTDALPGIKELVAAKEHAQVTTGYAANVKQFRTLRASANGKGSNSVLSDLLSLSKPTEIDSKPFSHRGAPRKALGRSRTSNSNLSNRSAVTQ